MSLEISLGVFNLILPASATNVKETNQYYLVTFFFFEILSYLKCTENYRVAQRTIDTYLL